ncbi:MBL fold metallo-hydrolase [Bacillus mangrovi]|uniref:MBL fold metallo-hydrolase n=1 Tax=Metabacillus mangrovi TaxID=1491830 RepID=A0A7X2S4H5_9BACI|nr:MBL fold metallo-hydrolase [Metabacillus mangrovi]MTH53538.1 MBL fold metallo-hydrolase [Metabacillus mangrovi]
MKIEFLGTGGATAIPRPLCGCPVCEEAREIGVPYSRSGPSLFVHDLNLLIDTPEDIYMQINRSAIRQVDGILYSHWHPDHVMGRRIVETLNADWKHHPPKPRMTDIYLPKQVAVDFERFLGSGDHFAFFEQQGFASIRELKDGDSFWIKDTIITPFRLAEDYVYAFLLENARKKVLIAMDETNGWKPDKSLQGVDLAILPAGVFETNPLTGERLFQEDHPVLKEECTFAETLDILKALQPKKAILTHIEEVNGLSHDELKKIEKQLAGLNVEFAYDTLIIDL